MPRSSLSTALENHFNLAQSSYAFYWKVTPVVGAVEGHTTLDFPQYLDGVTYQSRGGVLPSTVPALVGLNEQKTDATAPLLPLGTMTPGRFNAGYYEGAQFLLFALNYRGDLTDEVILSRGTLGKATRQDAGVTFELETWSTLLNKPQGRVISATCSEKRFGRGGCRNQVAHDGPNIAAFTQTGTIDTVLSASHFKLAGIDTSVAVTGWAARGILCLTSGTNAGIERDVGSWDAGTLEVILNEAFGVLPEPGDAVALEKGCGRAWADCVANNNTINFRGFNQVPTEYILAQQQPL